jgi:hypothetical protein
MIKSVFGVVRESALDFIDFKLAQEYDMSIQI